MGLIRLSHGGTEQDDDREYPEDRSERDVDAIDERDDQRKGPIFPAADECAGEQIQNERCNQPNAKHDIKPFEHGKKLPRRRDGASLIPPHVGIVEERVHKQVVDPKEPKTQQREPRADEVENGQEAQMIGVRPPLIAHQRWQFSHGTWPNVDMIWA